MCVCVCAFLWVCVWVGVCARARARGDIEAVGALGVEGTRCTRSDDGAQQGCTDPRKHGVDKWRLARAWLL